MCVRVRAVCVCCVFVVILYTHLLTDCSLFVGNLSYDCDEDSLREFFENGGCPPVGVRILTQNGSSRGLNLPPSFSSLSFLYVIKNFFCVTFLYRFGYADFSSSKDAKKAIKKLNDEDLFGRRVRLDIARPRTGGGGFSGDGGGGRGGWGTPRGRGVSLLTVSVVCQWVIVA